MLSLAASSLRHRPVKDRPPPACAATATAAVGVSQSNCACEEATHALISLGCHSGQQSTSDGAGRSRLQGPVQRTMRCRDGAAQTQSRRFVIAEVCTQGENRRYTTRNDARELTQVCCFPL